MNGYIIAATATTVYLILITAFRRSALFRRLGMDLYGPILLWRTKRGRRTISKAAAKPSFWKHVGVLAMGVCLISTVLVTLFLAWESVVAYDGTQSPDSADIALGPLGIDTVVLVIYLAVGLAIAVLVHELAHGILASAQGIEIDSLGLLFFVIPFGAFIEPNDDDLKKAGPRARIRLYSSGPAANLVVALVCLVVLLGVLGPTIEPRADGALVTEIGEDSPAEILGLSIWSEVTDVGGVPVRDASSLRNISFGDPGNSVPVTYLYGGRETTAYFPEGVVVTTVLQGPALSAGIKPGMIVQSLDNVTIHNIGQFISVTENATRDSPVNITVLRYGYDSSLGREWWVEDPDIRYVNLTSKWVYFYKHFPDLNREEYKNLSLIGVSTAPFGIRVEDMDYLPRLIAHPFPSQQEGESFAKTALKFVALPSLGYSPVVSPATDLYEPSGVLSVIPNDAYWILINLVYWVFWANLLLGLANSLPALPFDGGYVIRDAIKDLAFRRGQRLTGFDRAIGRRPVMDQHVDRAMWVVSALVYIMLASLMFWQIAGPLI